MTIITAPDPESAPAILRTPAAPVSDIDRVAELYGEFAETLRESGGIGLAAPQVGIPERFLLVHYEPTEDEEIPAIPLTFLINPEIVKKSEESVRWKEGCLSLPGYTGITTRPKSVKVRGLNRFGKSVTVKAEGLYACALQHEIDHLDGVLFTDHASEIHRETPEEAAEDSVIE